LHKDTGKLRKLRESQGLDALYSEEEADLGNEHDYEAFLSKLVRVSQGVYAALAPGKFYVVILSDTNKRERYYPMAFDFARRLEEQSAFVLKGIRVWCQDNKRLLPYGYPYSFVPNFLHHYCLIFRKPGFGTGDRSRFGAPTPPEVRLAGLPAASIQTGPEGNPDDRGRFHT
jgi:hypothetical protein